MAASVCLSGRVSGTLQASSSSPSPPKLPRSSFVPRPQRVLCPPCSVQAPRARRGRGGPGVCRSLFGLGLPELVVIGGVAVVLFGPKQLPEIGKSLGKTVKGFQEAAKEFSTELKEAARGDGEAASEAGKGVESLGEKQTLEGAGKGETK